MEPIDDFVRRFKGELQHIRRRYLLISTLVLATTFGVGIGFLAAEFDYMFELVLSQLGIFAAVLIGYTVRSSLRKNRTVKPAPGTRLNTLAMFLYSKRSYERVFEPVISDMRLEYNEALLEKRVWQSRWIWLRGHLCFWLAVLTHSGVSVVQLVKKIWVAAN